MADIEQLDSAEASTKADHIWLVTFEFQSEEDGDTGDWNFDEYRVAAGPDATDAIDKLRFSISHPDTFGCHITGFRLRGIKLLADAEVL